MTPFGQKVRELRSRKQVAQKRMAQELQISASYLSALEHGRRGRPSPVLVEQMCSYFDIIWDEADDLRRLAKLSHPRVIIDTTDLSASATLFANLIAEQISSLSETELTAILKTIDYYPCK